MKDTLQRKFFLDLRFKSVEEVPDGSLIIEGYASTYVTDRDKEVVTPGALQKALDKFMTNGIVLLGHDPDRPLGKIVEAKIDDIGLWVKAAITQPVESWACEAFQKIKDGVYKAFSIGGLFTRVKNAITEMDLMEISVVAIPANQTALFALVTKAFEGQKATAHTAMRSHFHEHDSGTEHTHPHKHAEGEATHDDEAHASKTGGHTHIKALPDAPTPAVGMYGEPPDGSYEALLADLDRLAVTLFAGGITYDPFDGYGYPTYSVRRLAAFSEYFVVSVTDPNDTDFYEVEYTIGGDGKPVGGDLREVNLVYVPATPATDPGTAMSLMFRPVDGGQARPTQLRWNWLTAGDNAGQKAGRVLSAANEASIRDAVAKLTVILDTLEAAQQSEEQSAAA